MMTTATIESVISLADGVSVLVFFTDGTTLRMSRKSYESGSWRNGTHPGLIAK
jgi:hypothetical protein